MLSLQSPQQRRSELGVLPGRADLVRRGGFGQGVSGLRVLSCQSDNTKPTILHLDNVCGHHQPGL